MTTTNPPAGTISERTLINYEAVMKSFERWCERIGQPALPASEIAVRTFIAHRSATSKPGSLHLSLTAIRYFHRQAGVEFPEIVHLVRDTTRQEGSAPVGRKAEPAVKLRNDVISVLSDVSPLTDVALSMLNVGDVDVRGSSVVIRQPNFEIHMPLGGRSAGKFSTSLASLKEALVNSEEGNADDTPLLRTFSRGSFKGRLPSTRMSQIRQPATAQASA